MSTFRSPFSDFASFGNFAMVFISAKVKIKSSRNGETIMSFLDVSTSCHGRELLTSQKCLLTLFAKIKFSQIKF